MQLRQAICLTGSCMGIPQHEIENIAGVLLPDILAYYESEEGQLEFAEWKVRRDADAADNEAEKIA